MFRRSTALRVTLTYLLFGVAWIALTDKLAARWFPDFATLGWAQTFKGLLFVGVTAALVYWLVHQAARDLRSSEARYHALFEGSPDALFVLDPRGRILDANRAALERYGYTRDELLRLSGTDLTVPALHEQVPERLRQAVSTGAQFAWRHCRKDGSEFDVEISARPITLDGRRCILSSARDISARVQAQAERARLTAIVESTSDLVATATVEGRLTYLNRAGAALLGWSADEPARYSIADAHPPWAREMILNQGLPAATRTGLWEGETALRHADGHEIPVSQVIMAHRDAAGNVAHFSTIIRDVTERKRAEVQLQRMQFCIDHAVDAVYWIDDDGRFIYVNDAACASLGYTRAQLLAMSVHDIDPLMPAERWNVHRQELHQQGVLHFESQHRRQGGSVIPVEITVNHLEFAGQSFGFAFARDITARRQAEDAIERTRLLLEAVLEQCPVPIAVVSAPDHVVRYANRAAADVLGVADEPSYVGLTMQEVARRQSWRDFRLDGTPIPLSELPLARALRGEVTRNAEYSIVRKDGTRRWELVNGTPVYNHAGELIAGLIVFPDITELKQAEAALRESEERYRLVTENIPVAVYAALPDELSSSTFITGRIQELTGHGAEEFIREPALWSRIIHPDDRARVHDALAVHRRDRTPLDVEYRVVTQIGEQRWIRDCAVLLLDRHGEIAHITGYMEDITARRHAEEERAKLEARLRQAQKMEAIGQLAGGVAHDFNNILTAIVGNIELALGQLQGQVPGDSPLVSELQQVERSASRAAGLTRQLLAFSRKQVVQPQILDLNRTLADMEPMLRRLLAENISLAVVPTKPLRSVLADLSQLEQVVLNLVLNARDALPDGGRIIIETANIVLDEDYAAAHPDAAAGPHVLLTVSDDGEGMDAATRERIFEPFFTTKPVGQGTGLGLATVYGIVRQAGGHVVVYSEPRQGSTFNVYLPALTATTPAPVERAAAPEPAAAAGETLLVCEDDEMVRNLAVQILRSVGYNVLPAATGQLALDVAGRHQGPLDLLITDVVMPDLNGRHLADRLTAGRPGLRVLFISGYTANVIAHHGVLDPGVEFLEKPFGRRALLERVRQVLAAPHAAPGGAGGA